MDESPGEVRWYYADIILEHKVEGDARNLVHVNTHLIRAASPEQAYEKALDLGRACELDDLNTDGGRVTVRFRGLRDLDLIHEELEDGAELFYQEEIGLSEETLCGWIRPKPELSLFLPRQPRFDGPNTMPESVMEMLEDAGFRREDLLNNDRGNDGSTP